MTITHAFRLKSGSNLRKEIESYCKNNQIHSAIILSGVGNLKSASIRMANENIVNNYESKWGFEIVSATGTIAKGGAHIHISLSDDR